MLAVQTRNPGRGYPPPGPWPHWNDLAGESSDMVDEIYSKLASKRQEMAAFHAGRLWDAGLRGAERLPEPGGPAGGAPGPATPTYTPPSPEFGYDTPPLGAPVTPDPLPRPGRPSAGVVPGKRRIVQGRIVQGDVVYGRPVAEMGFDDTGGMDGNGVPVSPMAAYETPTEDEGGGYHSADDWRLALRMAAKEAKRSKGGAMQWPANPNTKDSGARSSTWTRGRPRQSIGTSITNIGGSLMQGTENLLELADSTISLGVSGIGALATAAQAGAAGAHVIADVVDTVAGILPGIPRRPRRRQRAIGGGGGGDPGDDYPSPGDVEPPLAIEDNPLAIEDGRASSSSEDILPRPALPIDTLVADVARPADLRRSSHRATSSTQRPDMAYGSSGPTRAAGPGRGTRWVGHRGPGG